MAPSFSVSLNFLPNPLQERRLRFERKEEMFGKTRIFQKIWPLLIQPNVPEWSKAQKTLLLPVRCISQAPPNPRVSRTRRVKEIFPGEILTENGKLSKGKGGEKRGGSSKGKEGEKKQWLVVVESPSKAQTIAKYLGKGNYTVLASYGHVRDLPSKKTAVRPENGFEMAWTVSPKAKEKLANMEASLREGRGLVLATDPDREGEAIAWHVLESLKESGTLSPSEEIRRVCFHEITPSAVLLALKNPREVSFPLVEAYLARRALDFLMGFDLSPLLWRKLPGSKSAGRVQSVALKFVCEREAEIEKFELQEYWSVEGTFYNSNDKNSKGIEFSANLTHVDGKKLEAKGVNNGEEAELLVKGVKSSVLVVEKVKESERNRGPLSPYTTSTLQQDASSKLGFGAARTMMAAQKLYEGVGEHGGLITYMRTDSCQISQHAVESLRKLASERYGEDYVPSTPPVYKSKAKNAQEAHEAIRITDPFILPSMLERGVEGDAFLLYRLIWVRSLASQMSHARFAQVSVDIGDKNKGIRLHSSASHLKFPGFLAAQQDVAALNGKVSRSDEGEEGNHPELFLLKEGEEIYQRTVNCRQHFTEPPPRFTEGTLVKKMEEAGVGRPSTYASTMKTLQTRNYVRVEKGRLIPELRGRMVTSFLVKFFPRYMDPAFTAHMEEQLDEVSAGQAEWKNVLSNFWGHFHPSVENAMGLEPSQVASAIEEGIGSKLFPLKGEEGEENKNRICPSCSQGTVELKFSSRGSGLFLGCSLYPSCSYCVGVSETGVVMDRGGDVGQPKTLGQDKEGREVTLQNGPYGPYVQLNPLETLSKTSKKKVKAERASIPADILPEDINLEMALSLLSPASILGEHPEKGGPVKISRGRFGFYVTHGSVNASLGKKIEPENVTLDIAVSLLEAKNLRENAKNEKFAKNETEKMKIEKTKKEKSEKGKTGNVKKGVEGEEKRKLKNRMKTKDISEEIEVEKKKPMLNTSPELANFLGGVEQISRSDAVKAVWEYVKNKQLQNPENKRVAKTDEKLYTLLGVEEITALGLSAKLSSHLRKTNVWNNLGVENS